MEAIYFNEVGPVKRKFVLILDKNSKRYAHISNSFIYGNTKKRFQAKMSNRKASSYDSQKLVFLWFSCLVSGHYILMV